MSVGIFQRCENENLTVTHSSSKLQSVCHENKYLSVNSPCYHRNDSSGIAESDAQRVCNLGNGTCHCDYSSYGKGLISCTIIAACTLGIAFLLIFTHLFINEFKYKIHFYLSIPTIVLLLIGTIFLLITLILLGSTMAYDLREYRSDLTNRELNLSNRESLRKTILENIANNYEIRFDWAGALEIIALVLSSFTLLIQVLYLLSTRRNHTG